MLKSLLPKLMATIISVFVVMSGVAVSSATPAAASTSAANPTVAPALSPFGVQCQWLVDAIVKTQCQSNFNFQRNGRGETRARFGSASSPEDARILGTVKGIGNVAAPVERFRDGGHAYYLFGRGLHSCTYTGKCMDLFAPIGEPVYAFADGILQRKPYAGGSYGHFVEITHRDKSKSIYAHLQRVVAKAGPIKAGTLLGFVGCSGTSGEFNDCDSSEEHLHFEWSALKWTPGEPGQNPPYFNEWRGKPRKCYRGC